MGVALLGAGRGTHANDLKDLYELAQTRDTTLQVAHFQRDAAIEVRPQALAGLLPQISAAASATRERAGYQTSDITSTQAADCAISPDAGSRDVSAQRGRGLPTLQLTSSASKTLQNDFLGGNQTLDTVGVSISWPLIQGGAVASAVRQSRALYHEAQSTLDAVQRDAEKQTRAAFRNIVSGV